MTEAEWSRSRAPKQMILHVREAGSIRKLRLLACAFCRAIWDQLTDQRCRTAVEVAERYADGLATDAERTAVQERVETARVDDPLRVAVRWTLTDPDPWMVGVAAEVCSYNSRSARPSSQLRGIHANLVRDIFGDPFRPVQLDPRWRTSTVLTLAEGIYADRAFDRLPILADALMDAGCDNDQLLDHCRGAGPHVRGCWAIDLLLGKT
jgi:hypothetical protein